MRIDDFVYGQTDLKEPVLIELIKSKPLQRIKEINQAGTQLVQTNKKVTRYDHCVGVMLLLRKFGASLEEQIAGLLHDVPHTAFSHAADFVFRGGESQTYHERFLKQIVCDSEIPKILEKYGYDTNRVTDEQNFSLLEQDIPLLCADRIDYSLRDFKNDKIFSDHDILRILRALSVFEEKFTITDKEIALFYAKTFLKQSETNWNGERTLAIFEVFGELVRCAFEKKVLEEKDLFNTDDFVLSKLKKSKDKKINQLLSQLNPKFEAKKVDKDFDFHTRGKVRFIDPPVLTKGKLIALSKLNPAFQREIAAFIIKTKAGHKIKIVS